MKRNLKSVALRTLIGRSQRLVEYRVYPYIQGFARGPEFDPLYIRLYRLQK